MSDFVRGDVYTASFGNVEVPVVIVSRNVVNRSSPILLVVPTIAKTQLESTDYDTLVVVDAGVANLGEDFVLMCTHVQPLAASRLSMLLGRLPPTVVDKLNTALRVVFAL